ncbi:hypothetical protein FRB96_002211 [Tulasnella sp. 330]|nr:hypothetical protein FRB96_002211 [Tulasnella sp. 330]
MISASNSLVASQQDAIFQNAREAGPSSRSKLITESLERTPRRRKLASSSGDASPSPTTPRKRAKTTSPTNSPDPRTRYKYSKQAKCTPENAFRAGERLISDIKERLSVLEFTTEVRGEVWQKSVDEYFAFSLTEK